MVNSDVTTNADGVLTVSFCPVCLFNSLGMLLKRSNRISEEYIGKVAECPHCGYWEPR